MGLRSLALIGFALLAVPACKKHGDAPIVTQQELSTPLAPAESTWTGQLAVVRFQSHAGDTDPEGTWHEWLALNVGGRRLPLRLGTAAELAKVRADLKSHSPRPFSTLATQLPEPILTPDEAKKLGLASGDKVRVEGISVPLMFSGSIAMAPVYGIFTTSVQHL